MKRRLRRNNKEHESNKVEISKLDELIKKVLKNPDEFYFKIEELLSPEERVLIREKLYNKSCETCTNGCCRKPSNEKLGLDEFGNPEGYKCFDWDNRRIIGICKVHQNYNINELKQM